MLIDYMVDYNMKLNEEKDMIALFFRHSQFSVMYKMKFNNADRKI